MAATQEEIVEGLAEIVNEIAGIPTEDVQLDKSFTDDLDVDSLSMVEVVVAAEERFDVKIPDDDVKNLKTVGDATDYILHTRPSSDRARFARPGPPISPLPRHPAVAPLNPRIWRKYSVSSTNRTVVVTGIGATTPLGGDAASTWRASSPANRCPRPGAGLGRRPGGPNRGADRRGAGPGHPPPAGPPSRPLGAVRPDRRQGSLGRRRFHRQGRRRRLRRPGTVGTVIASGIGGVTTLLDQYDVLKEASAASPRTPFPCSCRTARPPTWVCSSAPAPASHPGLRLRLGRRGHRLRHRDDPHRARRRRRRRWYGGGDRPAAHRRVRQHDGDVQEQRRPAGRLAPLRRRA